LVLLGVIGILASQNAFAQTPFRDTAGLTKNGIEWCEENYQLYLILGNDFFEHHQHSIESRLCGNLYNDELWTYYEYDRYQKLIEQSRVYYSLEIQESSQEAEEGKIDTNPVILEEIPQEIAQQKKELEESKIPEWVRNIFIWYAENQISEFELIGALQYLISEEILKIPSPDSDGEKIVEKEINFDKISLEVTGIQVLSGMSDLVQALSVSNNEFSAMPDAFSVIEQRENEWTTTDWEEITPFMQELIENKVSDLLREHANNYPGSMGVEYDMYPEIILTNY